MRNFSALQLLSHEIKSQKVLIYELADLANLDVILHNPVLPNFATVLLLNAVNF